MDNPTAPSSAHLLEAIGAILSEKKVAWATIGALAVAYHGVVRASLDADALITLRNSGIDSDILVDALRAMGLKVELREGQTGDPLGFVIRIQDASENQVDLIGGIRRLDPEFFQRAAQADLDGLNLRMASIEDLLALKIFAGGPRDLEDAEGILAVSGPKVDKELLTSLCRRFGGREEKRCANLLAKAFPSTPRGIDRTSIP